MTILEIILTISFFIVFFLSLEDESTILELWDENFRLREELYEYKHKYNE